jgi:Spy/CpxP family protein refolding chaperone
MTLNKFIIQRLAIGGALALGLAVSAASAQERPAAPGFAAPQAHGQALRAPDRAQREGRRLQRLHDLLQIRPDQDGAFRAFTVALEQARPQRGERAEGRERGAQASLTAPERLDRLAQRMAERQQALQKTSAAVKTFYAVLSPEQRKAFDQLPLIRIGERHRGPGGRFGGAPRLG